MDNYISHFKNLPFETRVKKAKEFLLKYKNKVPVIINYNFKDINNLTNSIDDKKNKDRYKFLLAEEMSLGEFVTLFRKKYNLDSSESIVCFVKETIPKLEKTMKELYTHYKDDDYFLYIDMKRENTFG
jgi:hypothetical protein